LTNVTTAAVAVEVAPPASDVSTLTSPDYQQLIAGALANGLFAMRQQLSGTP
jgi:N-acetylmuramoyl-L-alanine amidase